MQIESFKINVINNFLNLLAIKLADDYLNKLKSFRKNEVDELVLKFLDQIIYLVEEGIDITNEVRNEKIQRMNNHMAEKFKKAFSKSSPYSNMCKILNFIYTIIKEEEKQNELFDNLFNWYNKYEDKIVELNDDTIWNVSHDKNNSEIDLYKEIKPWILKNNSKYIGDNIKI